MKTLTKICVECGVMFCKKINVSKKNWKRAKYCSPKCSLKNTSVHVLGVAKHYVKGHKPWNKEMKGLHLSPETEFKKGQKGFWEGKKRLDIRGRKKIVKVNCSQCLKELILQPNQVRHRNFCNRSCWVLGTRGKGSPVFKGEKAIARFRGRVAQLPEYRIWHAEVMRLGKYRCFKCAAKHSKQTPLEVDHIKRFYSIVIENNILTIEDARNCKELYDVSNGRIVCRPCHRTLPTYGTKGLKKLKTIT